MKSTNTRSNIFGLYSQQVESEKIGIHRSTRLEMDLIIKQIKFLQDQAKEVLISACQQAELNKALCYVEKKPGNVYYYYRRKSGEKYLTIMSPKDWGDSCPFEFLGAYRFEKDYTWVRCDDEEIANATEALIEQFINKTLSLSESRK